MKRIGIANQFKVQRVALGAEDVKKRPTLSVCVVEADFFNNICPAVPQYFIRLYFLFDVTIDGNDAHGGLDFLKHSRKYNHKFFVIKFYYSMYIRNKTENQEGELFIFLATAFR